MLGEPRPCLSWSVDLRLTVGALVTLASLIGLNCYPMLALWIGIGV